MAKKPVAKPKPAATTKPKKPSEVLREKLGVQPKKGGAKKGTDVESRTEGTATGGDELDEIPKEGVPLDESLTGGSAGGSAANDARAKLEANRGAIDSTVSAETGTAGKAQTGGKKKGGGNKGGSKKGATPGSNAASQAVVDRQAQLNAARVGGNTQAPQPSAMDMGALAATANPNAGQLVGPVPMDMSKLSAAANNAGQPTPGQVPTNLDPNRSSGLLPEPPKPVPSLLDRTLGKTYVGKAAMFGVPEVLTAAGIGGATWLAIQAARSMLGGQQPPSVMEQQQQALQSRPASDFFGAPPMNPADQMNDPANTIRRFQQQQQQQAQPQKPMIFPQESF
jgi:hypothetical protein